MVSIKFWNVNTLWSSNYTIEDLAYKKFLHKCMIVYKDNRIILNTKQLRKLMFIKTEI